MTEYKLRKNDQNLVIFEFYRKNFFWTVQEKSSWVLNSLIN